MSNWTARYEEGYSTEAGSQVRITDRLCGGQRWRSARVALQYWRTTELTGPGVRAYGNGLEQILDVRKRAEFAAAQVLTVWRRVSFVPEEGLREASTA